MALAIFTLHVAKNQAMLWSIEHYIALLFLFIIAFKCILNVHWLIALVQKVHNIEIRSFIHFPTPKKPLRTNFLPSLCNSDKFEVSCMNSKSWPIFKIKKKLNSQDVKDSERFKTSSVSAHFEAFWGPAEFQFSNDLKLNLLLALSSLDWIQPNLVWMHLLTVENIWYGRK